MTLVCIYCGSSLVHRQTRPNYERKCFRCSKRWFPEDERYVKQAQTREEPSMQQMEFSATKSAHKVELDATLLRNTPSPEVRFELANARMAKPDELRRAWLNEQCGIRKHERKERAAIRASPPSHRTPK